MTTTTLTLIRHGHTPWNALGRYQGYAPIPLSERGRAQAQCLADAMAAGGTVTALYSSDLPRCRETAAPIAVALKLPVTPDPRLRETDYGNWQGLTLDEIKALDGEAFAAYQADPWQVAVPDGESQSMLARRVLAALADMLQTADGGHFVLVTHGGPVREILRHYDLWQGGLPSGNASRTVLRITGRAAELVHSGDVTHLPPDLRPDQSGTAFLVTR
jgi:probable phosphoglycerate mutase